MSENQVNIKNKKAFFEYEILEKFIAGIILQGTEIKSIRNGKVSINESYCYVSGNKLILKNTHISEYSMGSHFNHEPKRDRILLLNKREIKKIENKLKDVGLTIIPLRLFISERGFAKIEIGIAKGKKLHDKRESIKTKDVQRDLERKGF